MKKFLTVFFLVAISVSVMACEDGKNGVMGLTGPSGIEELNEAVECETEGDVLQASESSGVITWACVTPAA